MHLYLGQSNYSVQYTLAECNPKVPARYDRYLSSCRMLSGRGNKKKKNIKNLFSCIILILLCFNLIPFLTDFYDLCISISFLFNSDKPFGRRPTTLSIIMPNNCFATCTQAAICYRLTTLHNSILGIRYFSGLWFEAVHLIHPAR